MIRFLMLIIIVLSSVSTHAYWSCAWPYRTELNVQENTGTTLTDYQVKITITGAELNNAYNWTSNGFDLRIVDTDDETLLEFWVENWDQVGETATVWVKLDSLTANQNRQLYIYYGNEFADQLANVPFTFVEPGIKFHTREVATNPSSLTQAQTLFDDSDDSNSGYGCTFIDDFTGINNSGTFGNGSNFIAYSETYFKVEANETGVWGIRYGADFGGGGGLYVDGVALEEQWGDDLWWANNWGASNEVLEGTIDLTDGFHKLEIIGQEGCCDGGITVQFQRPGDSFLSYDVDDIEIVSRACPVSIEPTISFGAQATATCPAPVAQYRLDEGPWSGTDSVLDQTGNFPGTMLGSTSSELNTQVCNGANVNDNSTIAEVSGLDTSVNLVTDVGATGTVSFWIRTAEDWDANSTQRTLMDASLFIDGSASDRYFFLEKLGDGRLQFRFEDDNDSDFTVTEPSGTVRTQGTWYHITVSWDFPNDQFSIYDGDTLIASGTPNTTGSISNLGNIHIGDNASQYNVASGNSSYSTFDEVTIYNSVISVSEIRGLMAKTRSCSTPIFSKSCDATFPDGISSTNFGSITFGNGAQLIDNPNIVLSASAISNGSGNSCVSADCVTGDPVVNDISAGSFQTTSVTNDISINRNNSSTIGISTNEYDEVITGRNVTLTIDNSNYQEFYIDELDMDRSATLNLYSGTYWINTLSIGRNSSINIIGGKVRLYVNNSPSFFRDTDINISGGSENLVMYFFSNAEFSDRTNIEGTVYGENDIELGSDSSLTGLVTSSNLILDTGASVTYSETAYDGLDDIGWCETNATGVGSITISAPATGINCLPSEITITLLDTNGDQLTSYDDVISLSTDVNHGDWSTNGSQFGMLDNQTFNDGSASYDMNASDGGDVTLLLSNTFPEVTIVTAQADGISQTATIDFQSAGFVFSTIGSQVSAVESSTITLQALETDLVTGTCQSLLLNPADVDLAIECISPTNCNSAIGLINSNPVNTNILGTAPLSFNTVGLDFGGSASHTAPITFNYNDAGSLRLYAQYNLKDADGVNTGNTITGTSNDFVTVPAGFCIDSPDSDWQCSTPGLSVNCSAFKEAGDTFNLTVTAKQASGLSTDYCSHNSTSNFNGGVNLTHTLISPTAIDGGDAGTFSASLITLSSGIDTDLVSFSDMGVYTITAGGNSYLGETLPVNTSVNIGRFYPAYFNIVSTTAATYDNGNTGFTYTGQLEADGTTGSISYLVQPSFIFDVRGFNNQKLKNYIAPLYSEPVATVSATSATTGALTPVQVLTVTADFTAGTISGPDASDQFTYTFNAADHFVYDRTINSLRSSFNNDIQLTVNSFLEPVDTVDIASSQAISGSGGLIYYGRIRIENAYGPETEPVPQVFQTEYFDGTQFIFNNLDSGTVYDLSNVGSITVTDVGNASNNLTSGDSSISGEVADTGTFSSGLLNANWSVPVSNRYGSYSFLYTVENWLKYDWDNSADGIDEDPAGIVNFGQFRGNDRVIYWKEINY